MKLGQINILCGDCGEPMREHRCPLITNPANSEGVAPPAIVSTDLLGWLRGKLADAERTLAAREQAAEVWNSGIDEEWAESAKLHPDTAKAPTLTKAARMESARREERIAAKCRVEVQNFKDVLAALSHPNGPSSHAATKNL